MYFRTKLSYLNNILHHKKNNILFTQYSCRSDFIPKPKSPSHEVNIESLIKSIPPLLSILMSSRDLSLLFGTTSQISSIFNV